MAIKVKNIIILGILQLTISVAPIFLDHDQATLYSPYNYAIMQLFVFISLRLVDKSERNSFLFSPSFIAVSYLNINFLIGTIAFMNGMVIEHLLIPHAEWRHMNFTMTYFNLANFAILNIYHVSRPIRIKAHKIIADIRKNSWVTLIFFGSCMIALFSFWSVDLSFFSSAPSDFYIIPKSLGAILIFVVLFRTFSLKYRVFFYTVIIIVFSVSAFDDKREAIFLLLPILLLESSRYYFSLNFQKIILIGVVCSVLTYLIIVMSILRGYGGYHPTSFLDATSYVDDYVKSDFFIPAFMNNIEVSYTFFHSNNSVEHILNDPNKLSYGSTIIKPLFILIPRSYFPKKPDSIIELYTTSFSPTMRANGVSWPISFQSEMFWNFHFSGILIGAIFFLFFNSVYLNIVRLINEDKIINYIPLLYIYQQSLVLFRGSGLDQFIIDVILSFIIFAVAQLILRPLVFRLRNETL